MSEVVVMLKITDAYPLKEGFDCIIPVSIIKHRAEEAVVSVYEPFAELGEEFVGKFAQALFSQEAAEWLYEKIKPLIEPYGYEPDPIYSLTYSVEYSLDPEDIDRVPESFVKPTTRKIDSCELDSERNLSGVLLDEEEVNTLCYGTVTENGIIASVACENYAGMFDRKAGESEIAVATSVDYAGNGYAVSNAAALIRELLGRGNRVFYVCDADNYSSCRVAEKLGLDLSACTYSLVCFREL